MCRNAGFASLPAWLAVVAAVTALEAGVTAAGLLVLVTAAASALVLVTATGLLVAVVTEAVIVFVAVAALWLQSLTAVRACQPLRHAASFRSSPSTAQTRGEEVRLFQSVGARGRSTRTGSHLSWQGGTGAW